MIEAARGRAFDALSGRVYYGWVVLAVAALGMFGSGPGQSHTFSVFVGPIAGDLGIGKADVASAYAVATLVAAFGLPLIGRLVDRRGPRAVMLLVIVALGLACMAFSLASDVVTLGFGFAALRFMGQGALMLICANLVSQWFDRRRGVAMSLMVLGFALSMAAHPIVGQLLLSQMGWRGAWVTLGVLTWALLLAPALLLVHDRPEDKGLTPDGGGEAPAIQLGPSPVIARDGLTLAEALRTSTFYIVVSGMFSMSMLVTVLHFYQVSILEARGLSAAVAASVFAVSAASMVLSMPLVGRLFDLFRTRYMFAAGLAVMATSLLAATWVSDAFTAVVYAAIFGLNNAFTMTLFGYIWPRYFGRKHLGAIQGAGQTILVIGASIGPPAVGYAAEITGGFATPLWFAALIPLACAATAALFLRTPPQIAAQLEQD